MYERLTVRYNKDENSVFKQLDILNKRSVVRLHIWLAKVLLNQDKLIEGLYLENLKSNKKNHRTLDISKGKKN